MRVALQEKKTNASGYKNMVESFEREYWKKNAAIEIEERENFVGLSIYTLFIVDFFFYFFLRHFFRLMAYNVTNSAHRRIGSTGSRDGYQQPQPQQHIYEEQPYYANERPMTRQSVGGDGRRSGGVRDIFLSLLLKIIIDTMWLRDTMRRTHFSRIYIYIYFISRTISLLRIDNDDSFKTVFIQNGNKSVLVFSWYSSLMTFETRNENSLEGLFSRQFDLLFVSKRKNIINIISVVILLHP